MRMIRGQTRSIFSAVVFLARGLCRLRRDRRANVAIITAVAFPLMLGFVGLASEAGLWMLQRRTMQGVADAAAYSGAVAIASGNSAGYQTEAKGVAAANGYSSGVTVNSPPSTGSFTAAQYGPSGYTPVVEVLIAQQPHTLIAAFFGVTSITIQARAVAAVNAVGHTPQSSACILALDQTALKAVNDTGAGAQLILTNCGLAVNSTATYTGTSSSGDVDINASISVTNAAVTLAGSTGATITTSNGSVAQNQKPVINPYASLSVPTAAACPSGSCKASNNSGTETANTAACNFSASQFQILVPGTYCKNNFNLSTTTPSGANPVATLLQGTYILYNINLGQVNNGTLQDCSAFAGVNGVTGCGTGLVNDVAACKACKNASDSGGVTIILTGDVAKNIGTVDVEGTGNINITAPTSGTYAGIALWQDPNAAVGNTNKLSGGSGSVIFGAVYLPSGALTYHGGGNATASGCTQIVVDTITITGGSNYDGSGCDVNGGLATGGKVFGTPGLVE